jgi:hypothetical protein
LLNYSEKKPDLSVKEKNEREDIIIALKECFRLFQIQFNDQSIRFDKSVSDLIEKT